MRGRERRGIFREEPQPKTPKAPKPEPKPKAEVKPKTKAEPKPKAVKAVKVETELPNKGEGIAAYMEAKGNEGENVSNLTV